RSLRRRVSARASRRRDARECGGAFAGGYGSAARTAGRVRAGARSNRKQRYWLERVALSFCGDAACCVLPTASTLPAETLQATSLREVYLAGRWIVFPSAAERRAASRISITVTFVPSDERA